MSACSYVDPQHGPCVRTGDHDAHETAAYAANRKPEIDYGLDLRLAEACDAMTKVLRTLESAQNVRLPARDHESVIEMLRRFQPKARRAATLMTELRQRYEREQRAAERELERAISQGRY